MVHGVNHRRLFAHEAAVADHVGSQDCGKPALNAFLDHARSPGYSPGHSMRCNERWGALAHTEPKVYFGSQAVIPNSVQNVRSWVKSGLQFKVTGGLLLARFGSRDPLISQADTLSSRHMVGLYTAVDNPATSPDKSLSFGLFGSVVLG